MEIWNHVFMQDEVDDRREILGELPRKNIDTGSSVERVATSCCRTSDNVFETDLLRAARRGRRVALRASGYGARRRATTSRSRSSASTAARPTFLIADGVQPSNEGRGYILRRMLRRVVSHARRLGIEGEVHASARGERTVERFGDAYPELVENRAYVEQVRGLGGGALRRHAPPGDGAVREAEVDRRRGRPASAGRRRVQAARHVRLPDGAHARARRGRGPVGRRGPVRDAPGRAARPARTRGEEGTVEDRARRRRRASPADRVRRVPDPRRPRAPSRSCSTPTTPGSSRPRRARTSASSWTARRSTPSRGGQVGDHGDDPHADRRDPRASTPSGAGRTSIVHVGIGRSRARSARARTSHAEVDRIRREATARAHTVDPRRPLDPEAPARRARAAGGLARRARAAALRLPAPRAVPHDLLEEAEEMANRRLARGRAGHDLRDDDGRGEEPGRDRAVRREVRRLRPRRRDRRLLAASSAAARTCRAPGASASIRILHEGSIGAGMRRVEALVGPDALREINAERELLRGLVEALGAKDSGGGARARAPGGRSENKRLESELGPVARGGPRRGDRQLAESAHDRRRRRARGRRGAGRGRRRAPRARAEGRATASSDRPGGRRGRQRGGRQGDARRRVHQAPPSTAASPRPPCSRPRRRRSAAAPAARTSSRSPAAKDAAAVPEALGAIPARLKELLAAG